jgi:transposase
VVGNTVTASAGVPLDYRLLPGNTAEASTVIENMQRLRRLLKRCGKPLNVLVISDAALLSDDIIAAYHQQQMGYLGRLAEQKSVQALMRGVSQEEWEQHPLQYKPVRLQHQKEPAYYGVVCPWPVTVGNQTVEDQALVVYSPGKAKLDIHKREQGLNKLLGALAHIERRLNQRHYKRADYVRAQVEKTRQGNVAKGLLTVHVEGEDGRLRLHYGLNPEAIAQAQALDGKYVLASNRLALSADEMLTLFKERDQSEKRHAVMKGPLRIRPLFLHTQERIESLVFIVMVALLVYTLIEQQVRQRLQERMTAQRLLSVLASWMAIRTEFRDGSVSWQASVLTPAQARLFRALLSPHAQAKLRQRLAKAQPP